MARQTTRIVYGGTQEEAEAKVMRYFGGQHFEALHFNGENVWTKQAGFLFFKRPYMVRTFFLRNELIIEEWIYGYNKEFALDGNVFAMTFMLGLEVVLAAKIQQGKLMSFINNTVKRG